MKSCLILSMIIGLFFSIETRSQIPATCAEINVVSTTGAPLFTGLKTLDKYTIEGVALNQGAVFNGEDETSMILYVQDDTGGIQVFSGGFYGAGLAVYSTVLAGITPGTKVRATGLTGHFGGKTNMNDRHSPANMISIENLGFMGEPTPYDIYNLDEAQAFDPTRASGGEFFQGRLSRLHDVSISSGDWLPGGMVTLSSRHGGAIPVALRFGTGIGSHQQPEGVFDLIGIFNQEDATSPYTAGYQVWPRSIDDFVDTVSSIDNWSLY